MSINIKRLTGSRGNKMFENEHKQIVHSINRITSIIIINNAILKKRLVMPYTTI